MTEEFASNEKIIQKTTEGVLNRLRLQDDSPGVIIENPFRNLTWI